MKDGVFVMRRHHEIKGWLRDAVTEKSASQVTFL